MNSFCGTTSMPITYVNRRRKTYYLHQGKTKTGKPKYFFSTTGEGALAEKIPAGYEIYENANAQVFLRKIQPQLIHDTEKAIVEKHLGKLRRSLRYVIDVKGKVITIFESVQDVGLMEEWLEEISCPEGTDPKTFLDRATSFMPVMRFVLENEADRTFRTERFCLIGSVDGWIVVGRPDRLDALVKKYIKHLGTESFYQLF
jgi:hypothetical protein